MSQQEFFQQPERRSKQNQEDEAASAYYQKAGNAPKEEHPSTFEDAVPPYAYRAQDERRSSGEARSRQQNVNGPDGQTFARGYHPYGRYQQSHMHQRARWSRHPSWQNPIVRWAAIILLIFVLLHMLPFLVSMLLVILGVLAVALLLPIFIIGGVLAAFAILMLIVLKMLGIPIRWNRFRARRFHH